MRSFGNRRRGNFKQRCFFGAFYIRKTAPAKVDGSGVSIHQLDSAVKLGSLELVTCSFNAKVVVMMRDFHTTSIVSHVMGYADLLNEYIYSLLFLFWKHNQSTSLTLSPARNTCCCIFLFYFYYYYFVQNCSWCY